jgi:hypothetical protein
MPFDDSKLSGSERKALQAGLEWAVQTMLHAVAIRQLTNNDSLVSPAIAQTAVDEIENDAREIFDGVADQHANAPLSKVFLLFAKEVITQSGEQINE